MIIDSPNISLIPKLSELWKEAFGDDDEFISNFFKLGFSPARSLCATESDTVLGMLYWFDMAYKNKKIAYIYGVATGKAFRGRGIASEMMKKAHDILKSQDYEAIALVPAKKELFTFYEKLGYRTFSYVDEKSVTASKKKTSIKKVAANEYFEERRKYLKSGYLSPLEESFPFLEMLVDFYIGEDFIASLRKGNKEFSAVEFLGNLEKIPDLINTLDYIKGTVRIDGKDEPFAMYFPLDDSELSPLSYLGFAFD